MEQSSTGMCESKDRLVLLKQQQEQYSEGTKPWLLLQSNIDRIVAQNYLEYLNS